MLSRERILKLDILTSEEPFAKIMSATNRQFSLKSSVTGKSDTLLIIKGRGLPKFENGGRLNIVTYMKNGERIKYPSYVTVSTETQLNIVIKTDKSQVLAERRRYYRVDADINCIINSIERNGHKIILDTPAIAQIKDLNIGGIFLCICEADLQQSDKLMLTILLESKNIDIMAEIIKVQTDASGSVTGYGCRFTNLTPAVEETFAKYVFRVQLDNFKDEL